MIAAGPGLSVVVPACDDPDPATVRAAAPARSPLVLPLVGLTQVATVWGYAALGSSSPA